MQFKVLLSQNAKTIAISDTSFSDDNSYYYPAIEDMPTIEFVNTNGFVKVQYGQLRVNKEYLKEFDFSNRKYAIKIYHDNNLIFDDYAIRIAIDNAFLTLRLVSSVEYTQEISNYIFGDVKYVKMDSSDTDNNEFIMPFNGYSYDCFSGSISADYTIKDNKSVVWNKNTKDIYFHIKSGSLDNFVKPNITKININNISDNSISGYVSGSGGLATYKIIDKDTLQSFTNYQYFHNFFSIKNLTKATMYNLRAIARHESIKGLNSYFDDIVKLVKTDGQSDIDEINQTINDTKEELQTTIDNVSKSIPPKFDTDDLENHLKNVSENITMGASFQLDGNLKTNKKGPNGTYYTGDYVAITDGGITAKKNNITTFAIDSETGSAYLKGKVEAVSGYFAGTLEGATLNLSKGLKFNTGGFIKQDNEGDTIIVAHDDGVCMAGNTMTTSKTNPYRGAVLGTWEDVGSMTYWGNEYTTSVIAKSDKVYMACWQTNGMALKGYVYLDNNKIELKHSKIYINIDGTQRRIYKDSNGFLKVI
jgi:hypothetical protein